MKKALLVMVVLLSGCGLSNGVYITHNVTPGVEQTTSVGVPMLDIQTYCKNEVYNNILTSATQQLIYSGKSGTVIRIMYREFANQLARPAFSQDLTYDLAESPIITFRDTKIEVKEASNSNIRFLVLKSPALWLPSGTKIRNIGNCGNQ